MYFGILNGYVLGTVKKEKEKISSDNKLIPCCTQFMIFFIINLVYENYQHSTFPSIRIKAVLLTNAQNSTLWSSATPAPAKTSAL